MLFESDSKGWPTYELNTFKQLHIGGYSRLIPVFHGVCLEDIRANTPSLLDIKGIDTAHTTLAECALEIVATVRPDISSRMHLKRAYQRMEATGHTELVPISKVKHGIRRRDHLPESAISRLSVLHACFGPLFRNNLEDWIFDFFCDVDYEREIRVWERMASCYLRCISQQHYSHQVKKSILSLLLGYFSGADDKEMERAVARLPKGVRNKFASAVQSWLTDWQVVQKHMISNELVDNAEVQQLLDKISGWTRPTH